MSVQIPEKKTSSLPVSSKDTGGKKELGAAIADSIEAVKAGVTSLENEARTIMLEADMDKAPPSSDQAVLSEESTDREVTPEQRKNKIDSWRLEALELWAALLGWMPAPGESIQTEIDDLFKLYQMLLESVLTNTQGQGQQEQLGRLENALSSALNRMLKQDMAGLNTFFETYGTKPQLNFLKASIYRMISGQALPETELERFWQAGTDRGNTQNAGGTIKNRAGATGAGSANAGTPDAGSANTRTTDAGSANVRTADTGAANSRTTGASSADARATYAGNIDAADAGTMKRADGKMFNTGQGKALYEAGTSGYKPLTQQGTIYDPKGRNRMELKPQSFKAPNGLSGGERFNPSSTGPTKSLCTARDLQTCEKFIKYFTGEGNLLKNEYINGRNEEVLGILLSITSVKCQEFCASSGITAPMKSQLLSVTDQMIDYFMRYAERDISKAQVPRGKTFIALEQKAVYKIYYEILGLYQRYGKAEKAILEGIRSAVRQFYQKKADIAFKEAARYGDDAEFFHNYTGDREVKRHSLQEDLKEGKRILEKDWQEFMKQIGKRERKNASLVPEEQSFWGMFVQPEVIPEQKPWRNYVSIILMALGISVVFVFIFWLL